jgi:hypothetical protein
MQKLLDRLAKHDPNDRPTKAEIDAAYAKVPKAVDASYFMAQAMNDYVRTGDEYYLLIAKIEAYKVQK